MPKTTPVPFDLKQEILKVHYLDPERSARRIAKDFALHHKTVSRIIKEGGLISVLDAEALPSSVQTFEDNDLPETWVQGDKYTYNQDLDTYVTFLKCRPKPLVLSGTKFRAMKRAYSDWNGDPATINEVCRRFSIPRDQFMELKSTHGWTHDAEPFSREEVMSREIEDLADDAFQQKRQSVWESFEKKKWQQTKTDAEKWNKLEQSFIQPLQEKITALAPTFVFPLLHLKPSRNPFALVTSGGELHYGGSGWVLETGDEYGRAEAAERLEYTRNLQIEEVIDRGKPEAIFYPVGHDWLTVDTDKRTTTKGTEQETDGTAAQILTEGFDLAAKDIALLSMIARVTVVAVPGNHDRLLTIALIKFLQAFFQDSLKVDVVFSARSRAYQAYGTTVMGFAHGDGYLKPKDYMATMAREAAPLWNSTDHRAFFTGHLHSEVVRELIGGKHYQMPSLRGRDQYHERNAFLSDAALAGYIVDKNRGVTNTIITNW